MKVSWQRHTLRFRERAITSRDSMTEKPTWFVRIESHQFPGGCSVGEAAMFKGISSEDTPDFEERLDTACRMASECATLEEAMQSLPEISSIRFGFESALLRGGLYPTSGKEAGWLGGKEGITTNGLVWMGDKATMRRRIREKLDSGFHCVKLKIGGIDFEDEMELLAGIRREFSQSDIELRLDANGGFTPANALERLGRLSEFSIHSLEQPIKSGQWDDMRRICALSPIDIALDEELIGFTSTEEKIHMLEAVSPRYIILKPSLCGGFREAEKWISLAVERGIGWWATSALESNIGLEALGRWTASMQPSMPQGLGTGNLYTNNTPSRLEMRGERLWLASPAEDNHQ